jgi:hypothetical protein
MYKKVIDLIPKPQDNVDPSIFETNYKDLTGGT